MKNLLRNNLLIMIITSFGMFFSLTTFAKDVSIIVSPGKATLAETFSYLNSPASLGKDVSVYLLENNITGKYLINPEFGAHSIKFIAPKILTLRLPVFNGAHFMITPTCTSSVTFKNISFGNPEGYASDSPVISDGAEFLTGDLILDNCSFNNCLFKKTATRGSAVYYAGNDSGMLKIDNCSFNNCHAVGTSYSDGGAIFVKNSDIVQLKHCSFKDCYSSLNGGAIFGDHNNTIELEHCSFEKCGLYNGTNCAYGGAISIRNTTESEYIDGCNFKECCGLNGGAIFAKNNCNENLIDCIFEKCGSCDGINNSYGGAIAQENNAVPNNSIMSCRFIGCSSSKRGGAIYVNSYIQIHSCIFTGCEAAGNGGAIYSSDEIGIEVYGNTFSNNFAACGGALYYLCPKDYLYLEDNTGIKSGGNHDTIYHG
jgi:hypothetical protein